MHVPDGFTDVPPGKLAAVVLNLEMREMPPLAQLADPAWSLARKRAPDPAWYRDLFRRVGEPYLWMTRLRASDDELRAILHDPRIEVYALDVDGIDEGILELDYRVANECEIAFFGVTERLVGTRAARWMMNEAIARAWSRPIGRLWLHTCTLDHPKAIPFYLRSGFVPYRYQVEILDDPRALGLLPKTAAPNVPVVWT